MKKVVLIASVLFVAVISTACINNFAVQDLNNKAKMYAQKGDYTQAIERLKSSIDLDSSIVETHYNLAVAYTQVDNYIDAVEEYKKVIQMKPDMAEAYYSLGTALNNLAVDLSKGEVRYNEDDEKLYIPKPEDIEVPVKLSEKEQSMITELYASSIENYKKYLELSPNASDKEDVISQINKIEEIQTKDNKQVE